MKIKKVIISLLVVVVILAVAAAIILAALCLYYKPILEKIATQALGANVEISAIRLEAVKQTLAITGLRLYNPEGFDRGNLLADVPRLTVTFDSKNILTDKKIHFTALDIYVKTLVVIKDEKAKFNIEELALFKEDFEEIPLQIDRLILTADNVIFKDLSKKGHLHTEYFAVGIKNQAYQGLPTLEDITATVISEMIKRTTIKGAKKLGNAVVAGAVGGWSLIFVGEALDVAYGKSGYDVTFDVTYEDAYKAALEVAGQMGKNIRQNQGAGTIQGYINDADVVIKITKKDANKTSISVSAKRYFLHKLNIAGGILYEIAQKLGKI